MGNHCCNTPSDFDIQTQTQSDGSTKVLLHQPLPVPFEKLVLNEQLLIRLLTANGVQNIKEIEIQKSIAGGQSGQNKIITLHFTNGTPSKKVLIKSGRGDSTGKISQGLREAWFYDRLAKDPYLKQNGFNIANTLLNIFDTQSGKYIVFMELLDNCVELIATGMHKMIETPIYIPEDHLAKSIELDPGYVIDMVADKLATLHLSHWCDNELLTKGQSMFVNAGFMLGTDQAGYEKTMKGMNSVLWIMRNICTTYYKRYPLGAQGVENLMKNTSWQNCQDQYRNSPVYCLLHGDFHFKNMLWNDTEKDIYFCDFECCNIGHPANDVGYFLVMWSQKMRDMYKDRFLARYHSNIIASGKVSADEFTLEQLEIDALNYGYARFGCIYILLGLIKLNDPWAKESAYMVFENFIQNYPQVLNSTIPIAFLCKTFQHTIEPPTY